MILVIGYAALSLFLPVRDGIKTFDMPTILNILFIKSIGPYWFLHVMIVCGIVYYFTFHIFNKLNITAKYSIFATLLIAITLFTPLLSLKNAFYYFIGVGIRQYQKDFSEIYQNSIWPLIPFGILITSQSFQHWDTICILACIISFFFFFFILQHFIEREGEGRNRIYRQKHLPHLHIPPYIHDDVQIYITFLGI